MTGNPETARLRALHRAKRLNIILAVFCVIMAAAMAVACVFVLRKRDNAIKTITALSDTVDEKQRIIDEEMISLYDFKDYAQRYGVNTQFVQHFVKDEIVYKNEEGIQYLSVDKSLKQNTVDLSAITSSGEHRSLESDKFTALTGIDVSQYDGNIDWTAVANDGIDFAFIRVGYRGYGSAGPINADINFSKNIAGAEAAGLKIGLYFFSQAINADEAVKEAEFVLNSIGDRTVTLPIVFDMEKLNVSSARANGLSADEITEVTLAFCNRIREAGYEPMVYGNITWFADNLDLTKLEDCGKWLAQYSTRPYFPYEFSVWQYSETGSVAGISGNVDLNLMFVPK